jgi:hypothetical protein
MPYCSRKATGAVSSRGLELDRLDLELAGAIGLVTIPVLDHESGAHKIPTEGDRPKS